MFNRNHRLSDETEVVASGLYENANCWFENDIPKDEIIRMLLYLGYENMESYIEEMDEEDRMNVQKHGLEEVMDLDNKSGNENQA